MPDFRVAETAPEHPKLRRVGIAGFGLWAAAGAYAMRELTDGWVPDYWVLTWPGSKKIAGQLVAVGLWRKETREGLPGYAFHDWTDYQRPASKIHEERAKGKVRAARSRERSAERSAEPDPNVRPESHDSRALTRAPGGGSNSGGRPVTNARISRNALPRCEIHRLWPPDQAVPPCGPCKQLRLAAEAQAADQQQQDVDDVARRRQLVADCPSCDEYGMRELDDGRVARCTHPDPIDRSDHEGITSP